MNAQRLAYCRTCGTDTPQRFQHEDPLDSRHVATTWRCMRCTTVFLTYADVFDAEGFALHAARRWLQGPGAGAAADQVGLDRCEVEAVAAVELFHAFVHWRPEQGVRFRAYATGRVRNKLTDWLRRERGRPASWRTGQPLPGKAHVGAVSLDAANDDVGLAALADRLEQPERQSGGGDPADRAAAFMGLLTRRDSGILRAEREMGIRASRRAARRAA